MRGKKLHLKSSPKGKGNPPLFIPWEWRSGVGGNSDASARIKNPRKRSWWRTIFRFAMVGTVCCIFFGGVAGLAIFSNYSNGVPVFKSMDQYQPSLPSFFYSSGEVLLGESADERRLLVPYEKIPAKVVYAFVAAEDDRFFQHGGVDPLGIARAMVRNLKAGRIKAGGSTITQQVAKSFLFDRLVIKMKKGICRSDKQCGWSERCVSRPGAALGRCVKRSFRACGRKVTIIYRGKPTQIYRGYSTMCDPHEICKAQCKDAETNRVGLCPQLTCNPVAAKPVCEVHTDCSFGQRCVEGMCKPSFAHQATNLISLLHQKEVKIKIVRASSEVLAKLEGSYKKRAYKSKRYLDQVSISVSEAGHVDVRKLEKLPGVKAVYRFAEKSLRRKVREAILAARLESQFTKQQILWLYLNQVYLGHRAHGVQAAAQNYFGKNVWDLNLEEAAILAALPKAPSAFDPYRNRKRAITRMKYVLKRMHEMNYITKKERMEAIKRSKDIVIKPVPDVFRKRTPYFTSEMKKLIIRKYGKKMLQRGGLKIYGTVEIDKQDQGRKSLRAGLRKLDRRQGYRGPLGIIERRNWDKAIADAEKYYKNKPLVAGSIYAALVTKIDERNMRAHIRIGSKRGIIPLAGMRWARTPAKGRAYKQGVINRIGSALKEGYWILAEYEPNRKKLSCGVRRIDRKIPKSGNLFRLRQHPGVEGAVLSVDPHSGYVQTLVGGYSYLRSEFNRAVYACRQPGSSFKPVVYTTALALGEKRKRAGKEYVEPITTGTILLDSPLVYDSGADNGTRYKPKNYSGRYEGELTLADSLIRSKNICAIKAMLKVGMDRVIEYAKKFGIDTPLRKELGMALGQSCIRPWELGRFYSMIARGGLKSRTTLIKMVLDRKGRIIEDHRSYDDPSLSPESQLNRLEAKLFQKEERIISKQTAFLMTHLLRWVVLSSTGYKVRALNKPAAGKTGTTNDSFDVWFAGITPKHATIVWLGFDKNERPLGAWESGGKTAAPVWVKYMKQATKGEKWDEWKAPEGVVWEKIDPKTGKLARPGTPGARRLPYIKGTEPKQHTTKSGSVRAEDFYRNY